jgi:hypothetical protein
MNSSHQCTENSLVNEWTDSSLPSILSHFSTIPIRKDWTNPSFKCLTPSEPKRVLKVALMEYAPQHTLSHTSKVAKNKLKLLKIKQYLFQI